MQDVELVIKVPEDVYKDIMAHNRESREGGKSAYYFEGLIQNGIPLPKGHGRLIDESDLMPDSDYEDGTFYAVSIEQINRTPIIIEADKGSEGEE